MQMRYSIDFDWGEVSKSGEKLKFLLNLIYSVFKTTGDACLKNLIFCNFTFFGINGLAEHPKKRKITTCFC
jgi:hypothetical protein